MKISLRKANAVQNSINEQIKSLGLSHTVQFNEFQSVQGQIDTVRDKFFKDVETWTRLMSSLYEIRQSVGTANATSKINEILSTAAKLEKDGNFVAMLASKGTQTDLAVLNGKLKKNANVVEDSYRPCAPISTTIFTQEEVDGYKSTAANLKKQKQKLQDQLLELNITTQIELSDATAQFLTGLDII
jgi:hypothetical protein